MYGFDLEGGLPAPSDYRDMPYMWDQGFFSMDRDKLQDSLKFSKLVVGNVHLSLLITETNRENLVTDAVVTLQATSSYGSHSEVVETYHELANPAYYEANIPINEVGEWRFRVNVEGPMGVEEFLIPLEFEEPTVPWGSVIALLVIGLLAVPLVVIGVRRKKKVEPNVDSEVT